MKYFFSLYTLPSVFVFLVIFVKIIEVFAHVSCAQFGVIPLSFQGFWGIFLFPLIHGSWFHLFSNLVSFVILSAFLFYTYHSVAYIVFFVAYLIPGLFTWFIGNPFSVHIGASGIVYAFSAFMIFLGFFKKQRTVLAISFIVLFLQTGIMWGIIPQNAAISWETHLGGFIVGGLLAYFFKDFAFVPFSYAAKQKYSPQSSTDTTIEFTYTVRKYTKNYIE